MFDLRYHVASLTAVFIALVIGILVGIGLSGKGFVNDAERANLTGKIADLQHERDVARTSLEAASRGSKALDDFADATYPSVVPGRLEGKKVAVLFVGPVDQGVSFAVGKSVRDAGGTIVRTRSISVPLDEKAIQKSLRGEPAFRRYFGADHTADLGDALAKELAAGGKTPLWDALGKVIVQEREGSATPPADAVVVVRSAEPQRGLTKALLAGMYGGLARSGVPAVGTEAAGTAPSAIPAFSLAGLSTVDSVDTSAGRLGLVLLLAGGEPGSYGVGETAHDGVLPSIPPPPAERVKDPLSGRLTVLVAARDEEGRIGATVEGLRTQFPEALIVVADDGSHDATAERAEKAGARVIRLARRGKGQALTLAERELEPGPLLLCDADLRGELVPLVDSDAELTIAAFAARVGGGLGLAKTAARSLIRLRCGLAPREPLSGQRHLTARARSAVFPVAMGFGVETRMTIDAVRAGLEVKEIELDLEHRATGRDLRGFAHRGRQLADLLLACGPQAVNYRGLRLPLVGAAVGLAVPTVAPVAAIGLADDLWSGPERGFRAHLTSGPTTGTLKLVGIPLYALVKTRSLSGALLVGLAANAVNQLDTRPGRALKAFGLGALLLGGAPRKAVAAAVLIAPYDLKEMAMLGDAGSNALGAVLGFSSVELLTGRSRWSAIGALSLLTLVGERRSLGSLIESTPVLRALDRLGRL